MARRAVPRVHVGARAVARGSGAAVSRSTWEKLRGRSYSVGVNSIQSTEREIDAVRVRIDDTFTTSEVLALIDVLLKFARQQREELDKFGVPGVRR